MKRKHQTKFEHSPGSPIKPSANATEPQSATTNKSPESPKNPPLPPNSESAPRDTNNSYHCKPDSTPGWKIILEIGAILVGMYVAWIYNGQFGQMRKATKAAEQANAIAHDALVQSQRPWLKIKHRIVKPLNFDFAGAAGPAATMTVEDTIENVGNGVALNVVSWEDVVPLDPDMSATSPRRRQEQWCNANKQFDPKNSAQLNGYTLFPRDPFVQYSRVGPLMSTVNKAVEANMANMGYLYKGPGPSPLAGKVAFAMVGCIVYRSPFDANGTRPYMTGFLYHLGNPEEVGIQPFVTPKGTATRLQLVKFPDGDFAY